MWRFTAHHVMRPALEDPHLADVDLRLVLLDALYVELRGEKIPNYYSTLAVAERDRWEPDDRP